MVVFQLGNVVGNDAYVIRDTRSCQVTLKDPRLGTRCIRYQWINKVNVC